MLNTMILHQWVKQSDIGRIKGALHIELQELRRNPDAVKQLDAYKDKDVYLICSHSYRSDRHRIFCLKTVLRM